MIYPERLNLATSNFVHWIARWRFSIGITNCPLSRRGHGHDVFKFSEISDNKDKDKDIVTMEKNRKSYMGYQMARFTVTLSECEDQYL